MAVNLSFIGGAGWQFFDNNGLPLNGGKIYTYAAGTSTPLTTYTSWAGNIPNSNPIILDSAGRTPEQIWATEGLLYKYVVADSNDVVIRTWDNIGGSVVASDLANDLANTSNNAKGDALIGFKQSNTSGFIAGATARTVNDKLQEVFSVKDFGAVGDGITNDTDAFYAAATAINAAGGGKLVIPPGTYIVGKQTFAGAMGLGYSYLGQSILEFISCTKSLIIEGNGATLKIADGLKFGSFDPVTGAIYNPPGLPFTNGNYRASIGYVLSAVFCKEVTVRDLEIDGNIQNVSLGGYFGDTGYQIAAYGLYFDGNQQVLVENVYTHHNALDGVLVKYASLNDTSPAYPHTFINVVSEYNARQGLSWVGGTQLTAINCKFNNTGQSTFYSSPGAGVDIEAESSVCRNGMFINCEFSNNTGAAMVADAGNSADVDFLRCKFVGQNNWAIWPKKPRFSFIDCLIVGSYVNSYTSSNPGDATKYQRCLFTDQSDYAATLYNIGSLGNNLSNSNVQTNVLYDTCTFISTRSRPGFFNAAKLVNCYFDVQAGTTYINNKDFVMIVWGASLDNVTIKDNISVNIPADGFYVGNTGTSEKYTNRNLVDSTGAIKWNSWSAGAGGFTGYYGQTLTEALTMQTVCMNRGYGENAYKGIVKFFVDTAAPVAGTWAVGDRVFNQAPVVGQPKSWVCTVAGTPGTWTSEGNL